MREQVWKIIRGEFSEIAPESRLQRDPGQQLLLRLIVGQTAGMVAIAIVLVLAKLFQPNFAVFELLLATEIIPFVAGIVAIALIWRRQFIPAGYLFLIGTELDVTFILIIRGFYDPFAIYYLFLILAGIFILGQRGSLLIGALAGIFLVSVAVAQTGHWIIPVLPFNPQTDVVSGVGATLLSFVLISYVSFLASQNLRRAVIDADQRTAEKQELNETLEQRVKDRTADLENATTQLLTRTEELQLSADISRLAAATLDVNALLSQTTRLLAERSRFDHVSFYLLDESGKQATLARDYALLPGEALPPGAKNFVGAHNFVGHVLATGQARAAGDLSRDPIYNIHPLPGISAELTLPLRVGGRTVGALDLLSTHQRNLTDQQVAVYSGAADQIAVALENARLFEQQAKLIDENRLSLERQTALAEENRRSAESQAALAAENKRLLERAQRAVQELDELNRRLTGEGWEAVAAEQKGVYFQDAAPEAPDAPIPALDEAMEKGELIQGRVDGRSAIAAPIVVRGQVIGSIALEDEDGRVEWQEDELVALRDIAEHVALSLENARLYEQTQSALAATRRIAERESQIAQIGERMYASTDVQTVLQVAAAELVQLTGRGRAVVWVPSQKN